MNKKTLEAKKDLLLRFLAKLMEIVDRGSITYAQAEADINLMLDQISEVNEELKNYPE